MTRLRLLIAVKLTLLAAIIAGLVTRATRPDPSAELVRATLEAHKAGRERIRTLRADYALTHPLTNGVSGKGRYIRTPEASLTRNTLADPHDLNPTATESQVRGPVTRTLQLGWRGGRPGKVVEATVTTAEAEPGSTDLWRGLLLAATQGDRHVPAEEFITTSRGRARATTRDVDGVRRVVVTVPEEFRQGAAGLVFQPETTFEFDPSANFLVRKLAQSSPARAGSILTESEVLEFAEAVPGVFVPTKARERSTFNGSATLPFGVTSPDTLVTLSNVEVNAPVAPEELALSPILAGTVVHDSTARADVRVDAEWTPIGPAVPNFTRRGPPPAPVAVAPAVQRHAAVGRRRRDGRRGPAALACDPPRQGRGEGRARAVLVMAALSARAASTGSTRASSGPQ